MRLFSPPGRGAAKRPRRAALAAVVAAAALVVLSACSGGGSGDFATSKAAAGGGSAVETLPADLQTAFKDLGQPVGSTPYTGDWKPRGSAPWTIGYASPYTGNAWQAAAKARLFKVLVPKYQKAGIIKKVVIDESAGDVSLQNQQIRQLVDQGADLILGCCGSTTALNQSIKYAYDKGVPFVTYSGYTTSPYGLNTSANYHQAGVVQAETVFKKIGGKGTVLDVIGNAGAASSDSFDAGVKEAATKYPGIKLVGQVAGAWSDTVTKTEVQKWLATNSGAIEGIVVQPGSATGALEALKASGRPIVPISLGGEAGAMCYWIKHPDWIGSASNIWPPGNEMELGIDVAVRTLEGQGPRIQSIVRNVSPLTMAEAESKLGTDCSETADTYLEPTADEWFGTDMLGSFFEKPADPLVYKP